MLGCKSIYSFVNMHSTEVCLAQRKLLNIVHHSVGAVSDASGYQSLDCSGTGLQAQMVYQLLASILRKSTVPRPDPDLFCDVLRHVALKPIFRCPLNRNCDMLSWLMDAYAIKMYKNRWILLDFDGVGILAVWNAPFCKAWLDRLPPDSNLSMLAKLCDY